MAFNINPETKISEAAMFHGVRVYRLSLQSIPNAVFTSVKWDRVQYDTDNFIDLAVSTTKIMIPKGVDYVRITAQVGWEAMTGAAIEWVEVLQNSGLMVPRIAVRSLTGGVEKYSALASGVVPVSVGDDLQFAVLHSEGVNVNLAANYTWMQVEVIKTPIGRPT